MTVSTGTNFNSYAGNGSTTSFAYTFKIFQDTNLVVTLVNDTTGVETTQSLTTDYTVTGAGSDSGGNVVFVTAPASGNTAVIRRVLPITQETDYVPNDPFPAEAHEDALDKLTMLVQQEATSNDLAISFPEGDVGSGLENTLPSAADRAGQIITFDTSGNVSTTNIANVPSIGTVNLTVSGLASFADGSLGAPSITNIGDTDTGIYFPASDQLAFTAGGNNILSLTSTFALFSKPLYLNNGIEIVDNSATALTIKESSNNYLTIDTTNGSEKISFGSTANPTFEVNGSFRQPLIAATTSFFSQTYSGASLLATNGSVNIESYSASKAGIVLNGSGDQITFTSPTLGFVGLVQVVGAITTDTSLNIASSTTVDGILDEDDMSSNSATKLATQQSIKAYVDAQVGTVDTLAEVLGNGNTSGGTAIQMTTTDELQFRDTALKISSSADGQLDIDADTTIQIVAPTVDIDASTEVNISGTLTVGALIDTPDIETSTVSARDGTTSFSIANSTGTATFDNSLTISRNSGTGVLPTLDIICTDTTAIQNQTLGALDFQTSDTNETGTLASIRARKTNSTSASTNEGALEFYTGRPGDLSLSTTINADHTVSFANNIDVSGSITADGLTVDAASDPTIRLFNTGTVTSGEILGTLEFYQEDGSAPGAGVVASIEARNTDGSAGAGSLVFTAGYADSNNDRMVIDNNGDISFYEDTGTTAKFFWDASAESLGIGVSSISNVIGANYSQLEVGGSTSGILDITSGANLGIRMSSDGNLPTIAARTQGWPLRFSTTPTGGSVTERMRIASDGSVGIGTTSPSSPLDVEATTTAAVLTVDKTTTDTNAVGTILQLNTKTSGTAAAGLGSKINFVTENSNGTIYETAYISAFTNDSASAQKDGILSFSTADGLNNPAERMRITSSGSVGIGTSSPTQALHVESSSVGVTRAAVINTGNAAAGAGVQFITKNGATQVSNATLRTDNAGNFSIFTGTTGETERMRLDSSGSLLVGKTTGGVAIDGFQANAAGYATITDTSFSPLILNRKTSDGTILDLQKNGSTVGSIGTEGGDLVLGTGTNCGIQFNDGNTAIRPFNMASNSPVDNAVDLGVSGTRFKDIYATNGTIQTSDRNEKQDIEALSDAEQRVAVACKGLLRKFRWRDSVEAKGDEARTHFGIIAQDLQAAFAAEGLDAGHYAMFISSTWTDEETGEERTRMGVRYSELLAFIIAAI